MTDVNAPTLAPPPALFESLEHGGHCTQLVGIRRPRDPRDPELEAQRAAARRGARIRRSFLLVHRCQRNDPRVVEQVKLDRDAGIETRLVYAGPRVPDLFETAPGGLEFGLWDDAACGTFVTGSGADAARIVAWRESRDAETLGRARAFLAAVDGLPTAGDTPEAEQPEDPMLLVVPTVEEAAERCWVDPETGEGCRGFHLSRAWWRVYGMLSGTTAHAALYARGLAPLFETVERPRILISATADHSLLAQIHHVARSAGVRPEITVSDLCPTPLAACRWYASFAGFEIETVVGDSTLMSGHGPFDAICTHLFLGWVPPERRAGLLASWGSMLRPGGRVVTNASVHLGETAPARDAAKRFDPGQLERFEQAAAECATAWKDVVGVDAETAVPYAREFLPRFRSRNTKETVASMQALFDGAGFDADLGVGPRVPPDVTHWPRPPGMDRERRPERGEAQIVAIRR